MMTVSRARPMTRPATTQPRIFDRPSTPPTLPKSEVIVEQSVMRVFLDRLQLSLPGFLQCPCDTVSAVRTAHAGALDE